MQNTYMPYARIIAVVVLAILVLGGYLWWSHTTSDALPDTATTTMATSTVTQTATSSSGTTVITTAGGAYTINMVPADERPTAPSFSRALTFDASVNASLRTGLQNQFAAIKVALTKEPMDFNAWLNLATVRLMAGDQQGAREVWDYVSQVWPTNEVSFGDLGDYYTNYQKDYAKAEANYLIAIKNKSNDPAPYRNLFNLYYTIGYKRAGTVSEDILKKGIAAVPKAVDMQVLLARYYRDTGRSAEAKAEYNLAIANAQSQSQTSLVTTIQSERDAF